MPRNWCCHAYVKFENTALLRRRLYGHDPPKAGRLPSIKVGDYVRIKKRKQAFEKGYLPRFTNEPFVVKVRLTPQPAILHCAMRLASLFVAGFTRIKCARCARTQTKSIALSACLRRESRHDAALSTM